MQFEAVRAHGILRAEGETTAYGLWRGEQGEGELGVKRRTGRRG